MNAIYKTALIDLLYQLADDNFIHAFRGTEWLGLAPHIEEDVAFSSISQDTMGHAAIFYRMLEDLGEGRDNDLAHRRSSVKFRNAVLLEFKNGKGEYLENPKYDWAFTVVRHLFYGGFNKVRLNALKHSSYQALRDVSHKILMEQSYHINHWETWFRQLMNCTDESRSRMERAIVRCCTDLTGLFTLGNYAEEILIEKLFIQEKELFDQTIHSLSSLFQEVGYSCPINLGRVHGDGRIGEHTEDLDHALKILSEVALSDSNEVRW